METAKILKKICAERDKKGLSLENMADELGITVSGYRKIVVGETKLSVERLIKISEILNVSLLDLLNLDKNVLTQNNNNNESVYQQKIDNFYQTNKEVFEVMLKSKDDQIAVLNNVIEKLTSRS
jgi:transcriptional regulator with XRE-family HTH domain